MDKKPASLSDVDPKNVTLKELVDFIEAMRIEFPIAIRILAKRLMKSETKPLETDYPGAINDAKIIEALHKLEGAMQNIAQKEVAATVVLSLHSTFGFGRKRVLRLWGQASEMVGGKAPTVDELVKWCEARSIDYDEVFGNAAYTKEIN